MGIPIHVLGKTVFKLKQSPGYNQFHHSKETTMTIQMFQLGNLFENDYLHNSVWVTASIQNKSHISIEIPLWRWNDLMTVFCPHNRISIIGKTASLYWIRFWVSMSWCFITEQCIFPILDWPQGHVPTVAKLTGLCVWVRTSMSGPQWLPGTHFNIKNVLPL